MAVKNMLVFQCDHEGCGALAPYGRLPDGWVWHLHKYETQAVGPDGQPIAKKVQHRDEREFCSEKHRDAWVKANEG